MTGQLNTPMEMREIIVVTDGKSNIGGDPIEASRLVHRKGIIVNAIGITGNEEDEAPYLELEGIAKAGGGICDIVPISRLGYSMQAVTRRSVQMTIEKAVGRQLREITGHSLDDIEPNSRARILEYIRKIGDEIDLKCVILLDGSGSMKNKIKTATGSIQELLLSLKARRGKACIGIVTFPGARGQDSRVISGFTDGFEELTARLETIKVGGATPTFAGIIRAAGMFDGEGEVLYSTDVHAVDRTLEHDLWRAEEGDRPYIL